MFWEDLTHKIWKVNLPKKQGSWVLGTYSKWLETTAYSNDSLKCRNTSTRPHGDPARFDGYAVYFVSGYIFSLLNSGKYASLISIQDTALLAII